MRKSLWLVSAATLAIATPLHAQQSTEGQEAAAPGAAGTTENAAVDEDEDAIIITATQRASPLSDVPIAVTAITGDALQNSGATDIRQLNQLSPSLLVSSSSSESMGGVARIRGIGTVGDNPGLESSVATFIDGVYRSRSGVGFTELGPLERVEVLRGPQGTLFGRNSSAGLINVVTARPRFESQGYAEASYGNYNYLRLGAGFTGPVSETVAFRIDGVYAKRDGFIKEVISGREANGRDRFLVRGKLLFEPSSDLSVLLIGDYARRDEECCLGTYLPANDVTRNPDGTLNFGPSSVAAVIRGMTSLVPGAGQGIINEDTFSRRAALTPGHSFRSDVRDWGLSAQVDYDFGGTNLTSITAYRDWKNISGQDADFMNLDVLNRADDGSRNSRFKTFTQELRLQGSAFGDRLDWLVGGYYASEDLTFRENTHYGVDYDQYARAIVRANGVRLGDPLLSAFPGYNLLQPFAQGTALLLLNTNPAFASVPAIARPGIATAIASQVQNVSFAGTGLNDEFRQKSRNWALFTHNIVKVTDQVSLTLGARYTNERKTLDADLVSDSQCSAFVGNITRLRALAAAASVPGGPSVVPGLPSTVNPAVAALATVLSGPSGLQGLVGLPCVVNSINGEFSDRKKEGEWSGTAVLSFKPTEDLLTYASYSRGYKAGGYNLDRPPLFNPATLATTTDLSVLQFQPEKVDAFEIGAKYDGRGIDVNVAAFYQMFKSFQLNTFSGTNFFVTDIRGCKDDLGETDSDLIPGNSACAETRSGVSSKGVEVEAYLTPVRDLALSAGFVYADTRYRSDLSGTPDPVSGNNSLQPALWLLPGSRLSNSAEYAVTGSANWTPPISDGIEGLAYADFRYTSAINTGSDLFAEKAQGEVFIVNARLGVKEAGGRWSVELWAQNLFDEDYKQVVFSAPLQGSNTSRAQTAAFGTPATQLFGAFLAEPRTYGVTVRTRF
jgi:iron complex outermembrane recepter protein